MTDFKNNHQSLNNICPNCGTKISAHQSFCKKCGVATNFNNDDFIFHEPQKQKKTNTTLIIAITIITIVIIVAIVIIVNILVKNKNETASINSKSSTESSEDSNNLGNAINININNSNDSTEVEKNEINTNSDNTPISPSTHKNKENRNTTILFKNIENDIKNYLGNYYQYFSISIKDVNGNQVLNLNPKQANAASVIKIYIMTETYNQINKGLLSESEYVTITPDMKVAGSGLIANKSGTQNYTIAELIEYMIINSDNTAANVLIDKVGMSNINKNIANQGLTSTSLNRKMMDSAAINAGIINTVSSSDLVKTFDLIAKGEYVNKYYDQKMIDIMKRQTNRTKIPAKLPTLVEVANKTGELGHIENDAGLIYTKNGTYSLSILLDGPMGYKREYITEISKIIYDNYINYNF